MALSGSYSKTLASGLTYKTAWTATQNVSTNQSTITCTHTLTIKTGWTLNINARTHSCTVGGVKKSFTSSAVYHMDSTAGTTVNLGTTTHVISHNSDGTKSVSFSTTFSLEATISGTKYTTGTATSSATLNTIPRKATLTAAPNFNDENNPTITYSNPAGNSATSLQACIASTDGSTIYIAYRDISKTGTSYTFSLTAAERTTLRNLCSTANSMSVKFYVKTVIGGETFYSSLQKTLSIVNATPTISASAKDAGSVSTTLTGDANKMIKGFNNISVSMTAAGLKGASIKSYKITNGGSTINAASGEFPYTSNNSFVFSVVDSRGNTASKTITLTMINYLKLTCNQSVQISVDGTATINIYGNYFNGTFGATSNNLTLQYRYRVVGGSWSSWITSPAIVDSATYSGSDTIPGLDYKTKYSFQTRATDKINTITTAEEVVSTPPIFDWGENDFQINVPLGVNVNGATVFKVDSDATSAYIQSLPAYNRTYALSPNMLITNLGTIGRGTSSSKRYKEDIKDVVNEDLNPTRILDIPVRQYKYNKDNIPVDRDKDDIYIGLIAEEVAEAYPAAAEYNENGELEMWNIKVLFPALLKVVQEQQKEIEALKSAVERSS